MVDANVERGRVKLRIQSVGNRDIEHRVHRMFILHPRNFAEVLAHLLPQPPTSVVIVTARFAFRERP
jgi:hypothetical protein